MNPRKFLPLLAIALLHSCLPLSAQQTATTQHLDFEQALQIMLGNSHVIKQAGLLQKQRTAELQAAKGLRLPTAGITGSYMSLSDDLHLDLTPVKNAITPLYSALSSYGNFSGVGTYPDAVSTQVVRDQLKQGLQTIQNSNWDELIQNKLFGTVAATVQWPLYTGGKIKAANNAAAIQQREAGEQMDQKSGELVSELAERYFGLCLARQAAIVRSEVLAGMNKHLQDALKMEKQGLIAHADVLNAQVFHAQAERELNKSLHTVLVLNEALANTLAITAADSIIPASSLFYLDTLEPVDYFKSAAIKNNPLLKQVHTKQELVQQELNAAKADQYPAVAIQGMYTIAGADLSPYMPNWMVGVGMKWTLFNGYQHHKKINAIRYKADQVTEATQKAQSDISTAIEKLYTELTMYREQLAALSTAKTFAEEYVKVKEKTFREQMTNATDVVDAQLALSAIRMERLQAMYGFDRTLAVLLQYAGLPLEYPAYLKRTNAIFESYPVKK